MLKKIPGSGAEIMPEDMRHNVPNLTKIHRFVGSQPTVGFAEILQRTTPTAGEVTLRRGDREQALPGRSPRREGARASRD